jgi:chemotaxis protein MotA
VGFANLLFLPMANKLKSQVHSHTQFREMIVEGVISIAEGENPRNIETKLQGYYQ